jgi:hypothetical protein
MIFATTINPRRSVKSFLGMSTSTISGETIAGEMNLKKEVIKTLIKYIMPE